MVTSHGHRESGLIGRICTTMTWNWWMIDTAHVFISMITAAHKHQVSRVQGLLSVLRSHLIFKSLESKENPCPVQAETMLDIRNRETLSSPLKCLLNGSYEEASHSSDKLNTLHHWGWGDGVLLRKSFIHWVSRYQVNIRYIYLKLLPEDVVLLVHVRNQFQQQQHVVRCQQIFSPGPGSRHFLRCRKCLCKSRSHARAAPEMDEC